MPGKGRLLVANNVGWGRGMPLGGLLSFVARDQRLFHSVARKLATFTLHPLNKQTAFSS